ncbi:hypothetical protein EVC11_016 [Rhizobium phage RHph_I20]|uniref:Uncharacterized protein n=1 Tax=Rhizobium phage RHph_I20 TaxID=2509730 RepID=A0A7S5UYQ7_9CAUD|nr:hypothetical protein EVC11_016 [Rhizobium phage RHph_I20]
MFFTLQRIRLNSGGYDSSGTYWGHGQRLYRFEAINDPEAGGTCRAADREAAKRHVWKHWPNAKFFR